MQITSKISDDILIQQLDEITQHDRFAISAGGHRYTIVTSEPCLTYGDLKSLASAPRPTSAVDGCVVQIVNLHDDFAAAQTGRSYGNSRVVRLVVIEGAAGVSVGEYHDFATFGSGEPLVVANDATPRFVGMYLDVTDEFRSQSLAHQSQARQDMGQVLQRVCVDADPLRSWHPDSPPGIVFAGSIAPALGDMSSREMAGLLLEAGFPSLAAFTDHQTVAYPQTCASARRMIDDGEYFHLSSRDSEALHCFRLHTDLSVQDECYLEIAQAARVEFEAMPYEGQARHQHGPSAMPTPLFGV